MHCSQHVKGYFSFASLWHFVLHAIQCQRLCFYVSNHGTADNQVVFFWAVDISSLRADTVWKIAGKQDALILIWNVSSLWESVTSNKSCLFWSLNLKWGCLHQWTVMPPSSAVTSEFMVIMSWHHRVWLCGGRLEGQRPNMAWNLSLLFFLWFKSRFTWFPA